MYRALIIDDEKPVRTVILALGNWSEYGISQPFTACNGAEGIAAMRKLRPHIVIVDMQMPLMNGREFLDLASREFPDAKFIVVSGYDEFEYAKAALQNGALDYLLKPIDEDDLNQALGKAVALLANSLPPTEKPQVHVSPNEIAETIKNYIEKNYCGEIKITMFSEQYFFSKEYLSKLFKGKYGCGIYEYALSLRMKRAKELLDDQDLQIQEIAERLGYSNSNYFSKAFKNYFHIAPSEYRDRT